MQSRAAEILRKRGDVGLWLAQLPTLIEAYQSGLTYDVIARQLHRSRNEIAGKVKRLVDKGVLLPREGVGGHYRTTKAEARQRLQAALRDARAGGRAAVVRSVDEARGLVG